ncbi:restriction endonuclease subunit S [Qipengyuania sp. G39]|uniref:Restriction endonuclease subunit S n=1 Tax=Qipengyuania profundimaris TaxID=3067652 RepID=A0ABT9HL25_9SPHN|nr:restriction endonuclease subunit S [Qipengyuania sp. G39]MDP4573853.1 restriction endonuclease subunit S [Qipengyuania sp. G39]
MKLIDAKILSNVALISAGYPFRGKIDDLAAGEVSVIQMRNVDPNTGIDWSELSRVELPRASTKAMLQRRDVILSTRGGRFYPYHIGGFEGEAVCSPHFFVLRVTTDAILPQFLAWQMRQKPAQDYFAAGATGSYILNLKREVVENLPIALPPLEQQRKIVELDAAMQNERAILTQLINNRSTEMSAIARQLLATAFESSEQRAS